MNHVENRLREHLRAIADEADFQADLDAVIGQEQAISLERHHGGARRLTMPRVAAAAAVLVLATGGVVTLLLRDGDSDQRPADQPAPTNPPVAPDRSASYTRMLIDDPDWSLSGAAFDDVGGEMEFTNGTQRVDVFYRPLTSGDNPRFRIADIMAGGGKRLADVEVIGRLGKQFAEPNGQRPDLYKTYLPAQRQDIYIEIKGEGFETAEAYHRMLDRFVEVDADTWLSAIPAGGVGPDERAEVVDQMLRGIPVPDSFDPARLKGSDVPTDRYQLGADVVSAVSCAWIRQWDTALKNGDDQAANDAVDAMQTARDWPVLVEMDEQGDYRGVIIMYADQMKDGTLNIEWALEEGMCDS